jgi:hypothetical protein
VAVTTAHPCQPVPRASPRTTPRRKPPSPCWVAVHRIARVDLNARCRVFADDRWQSATSSSAPPRAVVSGWIEGCAVGFGAALDPVVFRPPGCLFGAALRARRSEGDGDDGEPQHRGHGERGAGQLGQVPERGGVDDPLVQPEQRADLTPACCSTSSSATRYSTPSATWMSASPLGADSASTSATVATATPASERSTATARRAAACTSSNALRPPGDPRRLPEAARRSGSNSTSAAERAGRRGSERRAGQRLEMIHGHVFTSIVSGPGAARGRCRSRPVIPTALQCCRQRP